MGRIQGDLLVRTYRFSLTILSLVDGLPNNQKGWVVMRQLLRCGTAVGAKLREADHAFTTLDFAHQCNLALKQCVETAYWLELCRDGRLLNGHNLTSVIAEASELVLILSTIVKRSQAAGQEDG